MLLGHVPHDFTVDFEDVQTLNERADAGVYDAVKISYAAYPALKNTYELLPCGGALGRGCGPLLLMNGAGVFDAEREVLVPGLQTTANFLLDFWAGRPLTKKAAPFDVLYRTLLDTPGAQGVVIHEKRFTYAADGLTLLVDLGEHWERETGYPIPLGAIVSRPELVAPLTRQIQESLAWSDAHPKEALALCRNYADDMDDAVMQAHIDLYVNEFTRALGPTGEEAVRFFIQRQTERLTNGSRPGKIPGMER